MRGWLRFTRLLSPLNSTIKGVSSEMTTFGSDPEQLAREATVMKFDLNLSHHSFWIKSSPPNRREAVLKEAQPSSCTGVGEKRER